MAIISADTFRPLKRHIGVRLQQGVPIVDADWNEHEDIQRFELRAYLKWFVGDGIPEGTDAFRVVGQGLANDFLISAGTPPTVLATDPVEHALRDIGRLLIDGRDILLDADLRFRQQALHVSQPGASTLAATLGVPTVPELASINGDLLIYVDVWDRLLTPAEDPSLVFPGLGTESCARFKREWVIRARASTTVPQLTSPADPDYLAGHSYCAIARVTRRTTNASVLSTDVTDLRARRLLTPPATLIEDTLGITPDRYRLGLDRPPISLRDAINALLRGEIPSSADQALTLDPNQDISKRAFAFDKGNGIVGAWHSSRVGGTYQVFISRMSLGNVPAGFSQVPVQVTSGNTHSFPNLAVLPNGDILITYQEMSNGGDYNVHFKRGPYATLNTATEVPVAATTSSETVPTVVISGNIAVFLWNLTSASSQYCFRRYRHTDSTWLDASPVTLSPSPSTVGLHAAVAENGIVWCAFRSSASLLIFTLDPSSGVVNMQASLSIDSGTAPDPFILPTKSGQVWVFWQGSSGVWSARFTSGALEFTQPLPSGAANDRNVSAVEDASGGVWVYFARGTPGRLFHTRRDPVSGAWSPTRQVTTPPTDTYSDSLPFALQAADRSTWLFWQSDRGSNLNIFYKQLITNI
ncbi:hypothetical protein [Corallococcus sp. AS-1-6]|uniref:hypothetical protein n=1 Tax=Corallococcus sp. AS-1-6 TaxID=2874599 RepID=UPI001CBCA467|nr:hypothetical protein [Corallococcus sp. AS-1-6]MBZ4373773.1 hypothetical protein [Corallococcus sp. AS-1-6]